MERNYIIDNLKGIAFLLMFIQHIFYFFDVSNNYSTSYRNIDIIDKSGFISRYLFILLSGYSVYLTYKKDNKIHFDKRIKRSLEILGHGLFITLITYLLYPDKFIQFGILHFLALGTLVISVLSPYKLLSISVLLISMFVTYPVTGTFADIITGSNYNNMMIDWFPLNNWLPVLLSGLVIGQNINLNIPFLDFNNILTYLGKNSLNLYTIHIVVLLVGYKLISQ